MSHVAASGWSPSTALRPCIAILSASAYTLYTLSAPRHYCLENIAAIFLLSAAFFQRFGDLYPDDQLNSVFAHGVLIWLVHTVHVVLVRSDAGYIASAPGLGPYHRAYKMLYNYRGIGTSWQVVKTHAPPHIPSWSQFLPRQLLSIFCRYIALAIFYEISELLNASSDYPPKMQTAARTHLTLNFILHNWLLLSSLHEGLSIFFVCVLRLDEPHEWPPLYGDILEAYTVRRFWAYFWHRLVYAPFRAVADTLSARVCGQHGSHGATRRLVNIALVFLLSGLVHSVMDWKRGWCNCWGSGVFYFVQPLGFVLESLVQVAWSPLRERVFAPGSRVVLILERTLGYMWVWAWFFWLYPRRAIVELNCIRART